jgi:hypothetical protein
VGGQDHDLLRVGRACGWTIYRYNRQGHVHAAVKMRRNKESECRCASEVQGMKERRVLLVESAVLRLCLENWLALLRSSRAFP